ncbi:hypothetical protein [Ktedonospora formicarum]|uniref:Uncharacterized protein n=1 Tax=Ktedonospora formicarum TaxID=2778364 RepID=A0A8J3I1U9_9CHLR|nr:hypothetical protein [Ktedonospora formicarum]GHO48482.1 hypothetical protein KSX_66450 [Ktedonospora formicarum]
MREDDEELLIASLQLIESMTGNLLVVSLNCVRLRPFVMRRAIIDDRGKAETVTHEGPKHLLLFAMRIILMGVVHTNGYQAIEWLQGLIGWTPVGMTLSCLEHLLQYKWVEQRLPDHACNWFSRYACDIPYQARRGTYETPYCMD